MAGLVTGIKGALRILKSLLKKPSMHTRGLSGDLTDAIKKSTDDISPALSEIDTNILKKDMELLGKNIEDLKAYSQAKKEIEALTELHTSIKETLSQSLNKLKGELNKVKDLVDQQKNELGKLNKELDELDTTNNENTEKILELRGTIKTKEQELVKSESNVTRLSKKVVEQSGTIKDLNKKIDGLDEQIAQNKSTIKGLKGDLETAKDEGREAQQKLEKQLKTAKIEAEKLKSTKEELEQAKGEITELKAKSTNLDERLYSKKEIKEFFENQKRLFGEASPEERKAAKGGLDALRNGVSPSFFTGLGRKLTLTAVTLIVGGIAWALYKDYRENDISDRDEESKKVSKVIKEMLVKVMDLYNDLLSGKLDPMEANARLEEITKNLHESDIKLSSSEPHSLLGLKKIPDDCATSILKEAECSPAHHQQKPK